MGSNSTSATVGTGHLSMNTYAWEIPKFYSWYVNLQMGEKINSPTFTVQDKPWNLEMYPDGKNQDSKGYVSIYLRMLDSHDQIKARFTLTMVDSKEQIIARTNSDKMCVFKGTNGFGLGQFMEKSLFVLAVENTKLKLLCQIIGENADTCERQMPPMAGSKVLKHSESLGCFLNKEKFSDVKFFLGNRSIFAHKIVLSTQSPVFAAMFEHQMKENQENIVKIEDTSYEVFYELLRYMYSDSIKLSDNIVSDLLIASDKYELLGLKEICEKKLCENLSINNALASLALADMYSANYLKNKAIEFFASYAKEIIYTPDFESLRNFNTNLLRDVFCAILSREKQ